MGLDALLENQLDMLTIGQSFRSCTYTRFLSQGVEIELIFTLRAAVSEIQVDFQNFHVHVWA